MVTEEYLLYFNDPPESGVVATAASLDVILAKMRAHPEWDETKFKKGIRSDLRGSVETYYNKFSDRKDPVFDIVCTKVESAEKSDFKFNDGG